MGKRRKQKFGTQKIVALILIITGISLSLFGSGVLAKSVVGEAEILEVNSAGVFTIAAPSGQAFTVFDGNDNPSDCGVDDNSIAICRWSSAFASSQNKAWGYQSLETPLSTGYGGYSSCSGFMAGYGCSASKCVLKNGGTCSGTIADKPVCVRDSDCQNACLVVAQGNPQNTCSRYVCDLSGSKAACVDFAKNTGGKTIEGYICSGQGGLFKSDSVGNIKTYGNCNMIYGVSKCKGSFGFTPYDVCEKQCNSNSDCSLQKPTCEEGNCISETAQTNLDDLRLKAKIKVCQDTGNVWNSKSGVCVEQKIVAQVCPPICGGEEEEEEVVDGGECVESATLTCGDGTLITAHDCVSGKFEDTGTRCSASTNKPVVLSCKKYEKLNSDGECGFNLNKAFTTGFGEFFGDYLWFLIGLSLMLVGVLMFII